MTDDEFPDNKDDMPSGHVVLLDGYPYDRVWLVPVKPYDYKAKEEIVVEIM